MRLIIFTFLFISTMVEAEEKGFSAGSASFKHGEALPLKHVFNGMGCKGQNISPEIHWSHPPAGTKSFAVTVYDPDAPTGSGWWHWTVFNIPVSTTSLKEGEKLKTMNGMGEGRTDFGKPGYGGACPPENDKPHRYIFSVYALKEEKLPLDKESSGAMVGFMLNANALSKVSLTAMYGREPKTAK